MDLPKKIRRWLSPLSAFLILMLLPSLGLVTVLVATSGFGKLASVALGALTGILIGGLKVLRGVRGCRIAVEACSKEFGVEQKFDPWDAAGAVAEAHLYAWRERIRPENLAILLGFALPVRVRTKYFEPDVEELKEDRLLSRSQVRSSMGRLCVEVFFYGRLFISFSQSLACWIGDILSKVSPVIRWFLGGGS